MKHKIIISFIRPGWILGVVHLWSMLVAGTQLVTSSSNRLLSVWALRCLHCSSSVSYAVEMTIGAFVPVPLVKFNDSHDFKPVLLRQAINAVLLTQVLNKLAHIAWSPATRLSSHASIH